MVGQSSLALSRLKEGAGESYRQDNTSLSDVGMNFTPNSALERTTHCAGFFSLFKGVIAGGPPLTAVVLRQE